MHSSTLLLCSLAALYSGISGQEFQPRPALLIIDVQDCFLPPGGSLAVKDGNAIIPVINGIIHNEGWRFDLVVLSQDWHCPGQVSFASNHPGKDAYSTVHLRYSRDGKLCLGDSVTSAKFPNATTCNTTDVLEIEQTLWPDHCLQNVDSGAVSSDFSDRLLRDPSQVVIQKGVRCEVDSYSAFFDNAKLGKTHLDHLLKDRGINMLFITGLALDYCVRYTAVDGHNLGYDTYVVMDAVGTMALSTSDAAVMDFRSKGIRMINSPSISDFIDMYGKEGNYGRSSPSLIGQHHLAMVCLLVLLLEVLKH